MKTFSLISKVNESVRFFGNNGVFTMTETTTARLNERSLWCLSICMRTKTTNTIYYRTLNRFRRDLSVVSSIGNMFEEYR